MERNQNETEHQVLGHELSQKQAIYEEGTRSVVQEYVPSMLILAWDLARLRQEVQDVMVGSEEEYPTESFSEIRDSKESLFEISTLWYWSLNGKNVRMQKKCWVRSGRCQAPFVIPLLD